MSPSNLSGYSFDIKSGYYHMKMLPSHERFLWFSWVFSGIRKYCKFVVLPFNLDFLRALPFSKKLSVLLSNFDVVKPSPLWLFRRWLRGMYVVTKVTCLLQVFCHNKDDVNCGNTNETKI